MARSLDPGWRVAAIAPVALLFMATAAPAQEPAPIRVGCLGDSITAGSVSGVEEADRAHFSYPATLGAILGDGFEVRGFGAGGHALRSDAPLAFAASEAAAQAMEFAPDVAILMLGTNDSVLETEHRGPGEDLDALIARLRGANPEVAIWLSSPPSMFPQAPGLDPERRAALAARQPRLEALTEALQGAAEEREGVEFLDVRGVLRARDVTDGVHPNPMGAERLAYRFAEAVLGRKITRTTTPVPSVEYRGRAAGWGGGTWRDAYASLEELAAEASQGPPVDVLFLGDSITQGLTGHSDRWSTPEGSRVFDQFHGARRAVSVGLSGDRTEHILHRILDGSLDGFRPRKVVLQVGINNLNAAGHTGDWTYHGIVAVVRALEDRFPGAHVLVSGPFPGGVRADSGVRKGVDGIHWLLGHAHFGPHVDVLDLRDLFVGPDGGLLETMARDGIHITALGQRRWMEALEPYFMEPVVTEDSGRINIRLATDVSVELHRSRGIRSLDVGTLSVPSRDPSGREWLLDGLPTAMRVTDRLLRGGSVRLAMEFDLESWVADEERKASTVPDGKDMAETWRLASLGSARGYDRMLTKRSQNASVGEPFTITTRRAQGPLVWKVIDRPVTDFHGHSTVATSGLSYDIRRIEIEGGAKGWWFRSGVHLMNQAVNLGKNPTLREVVLIEPPGTPPVPLGQVIRAYVMVPQDRQRLLESAD